MSEFSLFKRTKIFKENKKGHIYTYDSENAIMRPNKPSVNSSYCASPLILCDKHKNDAHIASDLVVDIAILF